MNKMKTSCSRCVDGRLSCSYCGNFVIKNGKTKGNKQRYLCKHCNITRVAKVTRIDFGLRFDRQIIKLIKEGCGIRSIGRLLEISPTTVIRKTIGISDRIKVPLNLLKGRSYQVDELHTYIGNKDQEICVIYSWDAVEKRAISFVAGTRTKVNLRKVIEPLILADAKNINTDCYSGYKNLIPKKIHTKIKRKNNHIERHNLNLRTHLKRLNRKTICYSKSLAMLTAVVKIYFWG